MSNLFSGAYEEALEQLRKDKGPVIATIVRSVIESKNAIAEYEQSLDELNLDDKVKEKLVSLMVTYVTNTMSAMCSVAGKGFRAEVQPIVEQIVNSATQTKHLQ